MQLSASEQAARLLRVYFAEEALEDVPVCQLQSLQRPLHLCINGQHVIVVKYNHKRYDEVYLKANTTVKTAGGNKRSPAVYIGRPDAVTHEAVIAAAAKMEEKLRQYADLPLAGD
jgi:hypothetical protein